MDLEDKIVKEFAEWARTTQAGYGEDEADIWFEDIPAYDALEWKVREIVRTLLTEKDKQREEAVAEEHNRVIKTIVEEWKLEGSELTRLVIALTPPTN